MSEFTFTDQLFMVNSIDQFPNYRQLKLNILPPIELEFEDNPIENSHIEFRLILKSLWN